ncbi:MAG: glutamate racemase [Treponema sp.]|nr:glutamate racemase [Treponema sp.]
MKPILFLDSGIGGIPYCRHFHRRNPGEPIVYLADRLHFPYGKWEKKELAAILTGLIEQVINITNPKIAVLACNTATIAGLSQLREHFPMLPLVGTVPAVKPATLASKNGKIGVLGTELTIKEPFIREIAAQYGNGAEVIGIAAPELVEFIETQFNTASPEQRTAMARDYLNRFRAAGVDSLVLGCTHFLFLQEEFHQEAAPDITVFESVRGITKRVESLLEEQHTKANDAPRAENRLLLTGPAAPEPSWIEWAEHLGFSLSLLEKA